MRPLILAAGRFDDALKTRIAQDREPRLDVFELADAMAATVMDFGDVDRSNSPVVKLVARTAGASAALATLGFQQRARFDAIFTTGEDIGLPLAALLKTSKAGCSHTMIAHTLYPTKKRIFFTLGGVASRIDRILVYSTAEERLAIDELHVPARQVERLYYHADQKFFRPDDTVIEPGLVCAAGQLLRDYECLIDAVRGLPVRVQIAAGSPWIDSKLEPGAALPPNVTWGKLDRFELRSLYARSELAVVPIKQNKYQTGIATILEMMAMGKCVVASKTEGQTDTIVDGVTGVYVPPGDSAALRSAIEGLLANPDRIRDIGRAARQFIEKEAGLDLFVERIKHAVMTGHATRFPS
jgi:glycosyltransferase involved in cell wall biosynthesis